MTTWVTLQLVWSFEVNFSWNFQQRTLAGCYMSSLNLFFFLYTVFTSLCMLHQTKIALRSDQTWSKHTCEAHYCHSSGRVPFVLLWQVFSIYAAHSWLSSDCVTVALFSLWTEFPLDKSHMCLFPFCHWNSMNKL